MRWDSVSGATGYQVWFPEIEKVISAYTNVADLREFYTLHSWYSTVQWRVRAVRRVFGTVPNGLPVVSYGPWSPTYTASNPAPATGKLQTTLAISDEISDGKKQSAHELMPGLVYSGDTGTSGRSYALYRAYASTDTDCVNIVYRVVERLAPDLPTRSLGQVAPARER